MNKEELKNLLPHREPMLLIDEASVTEDNPNKSIGYATIRGDEFFLQGHFPGNPVVPGVILCEMMAQTTCVILEKVIKGKLTVYTGLNKVKFKRQVKPGETVVFTCEIVREKAGFFFAVGEGRVDGELAVSGEFSCKLI